MAKTPPQPDPIESELIRLLDGADEEFWPGVARLCQQHPERSKEIQREAERLQAAKEGKRAPGSTATQPAAPRDDADTKKGDRVGPFTVLDEIGHGGMGAVYLAEQREPVRRRVALKVIKLGMDTKAVIARFESERQALAMMDHSHIAKVFEAGVTKQGRPYFAMEYVKGVPITRYCDESKLSLEDRLALFKQVCSGVQHAHQKGVIHRDLTPNNVLVTLQDGKPAAKIIDFGLARATDQRLTEKTLFTEQGVILGTPEYMSPEQAGLNALDIDMRSDVYTLGVLLYELLTGKLPFEGATLRAGGYDAMCKTIREADPPRPSTKVTTHQGGTAGAARLRRTDAGTLLKRLRGDLDWIVLKCLEKDRTRRYETVSALADDIERHLASEPVLARAPSAAYRFAKFARRYRGQLVAATAVFVSLVGGLGLALYFWRDAVAQAAEAKLQKGIAQEQARAAETARAGEAAKAKEASESAAAVERNARLLADKVREFDQLAGVVHLERLQKGLDDLAAPWKDLSAAQTWLADADRVLALRPEVEKTVADLRKRALPATSPESVGESRTYRFESEAQGFLHEALSGLLVKLEAFAQAERAEVQLRLRCAQLTTSHPKARATWQQAKEAIAKADGDLASALYQAHPIKLRPQLGLVPIGMNPVTRLWEFYDLRSACDLAAGTDPASLEIPSHDPEGRIAVGDGTGIVFVMLPGGTFTMGAQAKDKDGLNYDPSAQDDEGPPHPVTLSPFFLARHELTQGQWRRLGGKRDQRLLATGDTYPIADVDWITSDALLRSRGLTLPTEGQWEYGCRGATRTPWWTGADEASLGDELKSLRPVGSGRSNPFGLSEVHGNVWEWCADGYDDYSKPWRAGDGLRLVDEGSSAIRVYRGGGFGYVARLARSAFRFVNAPANRFGLFGVRPARASRLDD